MVTVQLTDEDPGFLGRYTAGETNDYFPEGTKCACWAIGWTGKVTRDPETDRIHLPGWTGELHVEVSGREYSNAAQYRTEAGVDELSKAVAFQLLPDDYDYEAYNLTPERRQREFLQTLEGTPLWDAAESVILSVDQEMDAVYRKVCPGDFEEEYEEADYDDEDYDDEEPEVMAKEVVAVSTPDKAGTASPPVGALQRSATDVAIGTDQETGQEVVLPFAARDRGLAIVGKSGTGKSSILEHLILADLSVGHPGCCH